MAVSKKKTLKRKTTSKKKNSPNKLGKKLLITFAILIVLSWGSVWFFLSDADKNPSNWVRSATISILADAGFRVKNIFVEGRQYSDPDILLALINIGEGDPIFMFNPKEAKGQVEKIGWVKSALVERRLPDTIYVKLEERTPLALWQNGGDLSLIDSDGELLTQSNLEKFKDFLMIKGAGAPKKAVALIAMLDIEAELKALVDRAELVDKRRWNLYLRDGKLIKLPEDNTALAMRNIMLSHHQDNILNKEMVTVIDARYQGRLIVRTKLGKVQDYKAKAI